MNMMQALTGYRETVLEIEALAQQLEHSCPTGRPAGCRGANAGEHLPGTNDPLAAAMQLADGLEEMIRKKTAEQEQLRPKVCEAIQAIRNGRVFQVVQGYYLMALTDEQIGRQLGLSTTRINQIRNRYLKELAH